MLPPTFEQEKNYNLLLGFWVMIRLSPLSITCKMYTLAKARQKWPLKTTFSAGKTEYLELPPHLIRSFKNAASVHQFQIEQSDKNKRRHMLVIQSEQPCFHSPAAPAVTIAPNFSRLLPHLSPAQLLFKICMDWTSHTYCQSQHRLCLFYARTGSPRPQQMNDGPW